MLMRFDPFRDFDRVWEQIAAQQTGRQARSFPMDAYRRGDEFVVHFDLPGVDPGSIEISVDRNILTVAADRRFEQRPDDEILVTERAQGTYTRQLMLGDQLDADRIEAGYDRGVLTLTIPVAERAKPRRVEITTQSDVAGGRAGSRRTSCPGRNGVRVANATLMPAAARTSRLPHATGSAGTASPRRAAAGPPRRPRAVHQPRPSYWSHVAGVQGAQRRRRRARARERAARGAQERASRPARARREARRLGMVRPARSASSSRVCRARGPVASAV
jgi:HSP20 family protein